MSFRDDLAAAKIRAAALEAENKKLRTVRAPQIRAFAWKSFVLLTILGVGVVVWGVVGCIVGDTTGHLQGLTRRYQDIGRRTVRAEQHLREINAKIARARPACPPARERPVKATPRSSAVSAAALWQRLAQCSGWRYMPNDTRYVEGVVIERRYAMPVSNVDGRFVASRAGSGTDLLILLPDREKISVRNDTGTTIRVGSILGTIWNGQIQLITIQMTGK